MKHILRSILALSCSLAAVVSVGATPTNWLERRVSAISVTPHDSFSSSIGVLGCKVNTNRIAYWPSLPGCSEMCVKVTSNGRSVHLLKVDQSGGAYDISYDAWNYLSTGQSASSVPAMGGSIDATYEDVDMCECSSLLKNSYGKLAFSAANGMNFVASCLFNSWFATNYALYNIATSACTLGYDEICSLDLAVSNQPFCPHQLGSLDLLQDAERVSNVAYGTGKSVEALQ